MNIEDTSHVLVSDMLKDDLPDLLRNEVIDKLDQKILVIFERKLQNNSIEPLVGTLIGLSIKSDQLEFEVNSELNDSLAFDLEPLAPITRVSLQMGEKERIFTPNNEKFETTNVKVVDIDPQKDMCIIIVTLKNT